MWDDYIQHNPTCADGKAGFLEFIKGFWPWARKSTSSD